MLALPAYADTLDPCTGAVGIAGTLCDITSANANTIIQNVIIFIVVIAVIIALVYLLYGGIKWVTSGGDKEKVESARNHITAAIVGLIIVFLAIFIVSVVMTLFGLSYVNLEIPSLQGGTAGTT
jgi:succinate dehydrogenase hydrophobic anchor subunit